MKIRRILVTEITGHAIDRVIERAKERGVRMHDRRAIERAIKLACGAGVEHVETRHNGAEVFNLPTLGVGILAKREGFGYAIVTTVEPRW